MLVQTMDYITGKEPQAQRTLTFARHTEIQDTHGELFPNNIYPSFLYHLGIWQVLLLVRPLCWLPNLMNKGWGQICSIYLIKHLIKATLNRTPTSRRTTACSKDLRHAPSSQKSWIQAAEQILCSSGLCIRNLEFFTFCLFCDSKYVAMCSTMFHQGSNGGNLSDGDLVSSLTLVGLISVQVLDDSISSDDSP